MSEKIFMGLDIGTDSVGWAVTDDKYALKKFRGEPMWGSVLFEGANLKAERRAFRISRRRLQRRQQRIQLLQELFANEISKIDPGFFKRLRASALYRDEAGEPFSVFCDKNYTDKDYHNQYPTIHHLIVDLMESDAPRDVRLVYLACAWLMAHRGHFLSEVSKDNISALTDFQSIYESFDEYIRSLSDDYSTPWDKEKTEVLKQILPKRQSKKIKFEALEKELFDGSKCPKVVSESFPFRCDILLKSLCGSVIKADELFDNETYSELESFSLAGDDEVLAALMVNLGEDGGLIHHLKQIYDWSVLVDILNGEASISLSKIRVYKQHKEDLKTLKYLVKNYLPDLYDEVFRKLTPDAYIAYSKHVKKGTQMPDKWKWTEKTAFSDYLKKLFAKMEKLITEQDWACFEEAVKRNQLQAFLPKQKDTDNRVIPYQLYYTELKAILDKATRYLPFLAEKDEGELTVSEKVLSIFEFKIPYFVGPLNPRSNNAWIERKAAGKIYPWNFENMVDLDKSEKAFIQRMLGNCTYLAGEKTIPRESLLYRKYMVLNEINNIRINGERISVDLKQDIFRDLFCVRRKVTRKNIEEYLLSRGRIENKEQVSGIDIQINAQLKSYHDFRQLLEKGILKEKDVESIIEHATYTEDSHRQLKWVQAHYPHISDDDVKYISRLKYKDFGRLSKKLLNELEGASKEGGEVFTILSALWNTNYNLMEILSESFSFKESIERHNRNYYQNKKVSLEERLGEMYISNAVKRPILRALEVVKEVTKASGKAPDRIFIEMARGASEDQKKKRTKSRKDQILELYKKCKDQDVRELHKQLEAMGDKADNRLQSDKLYLYYMQLGRSIYSGKPIEIEQIGTKLYDIDHIYPQRLVKDDSIINNKVLCLSGENGMKQDVYPVPEIWRRQQRSFWEHLKNAGLMSEEKFKRLTRETGFTADEKMGFINRQLTETHQSTKAVAELLKEKYPDTEIVYVKSRLTSDFRQYIERYKSRSFNDLHHAKDAYLNIVTGNVYHMHFSKRWFSLDQEYSLNMRALFGDGTWKAKNGEEVWNGGATLALVKKTVEKNQGHLTQYAFCRHGGYFDQMPVRKGKDKIPRKAGLSTDRYGGYNKPTASFFILVEYRAGKEHDIIFLPIELLYAERFMNDASYANEYAKEQITIIRKKAVEEVSFPLGMRQIKINTIISMDGFRSSLGGKSGGGSQVIVSGLVPFAAAGKWQNYIAHLENYLEKIGKNRSLIFDPLYDKINKEQNIELYDLYLNKLNSGVFSKRYNVPKDSLEDGRDTFLLLSEIDQAKVLHSIHLLFSRASGGVDLTGIGGKGKAGATFPPATISGWGKKYKDVRIIDTSATGLWEKTTENILELL